MVPLSPTVGSGVTFVVMALAVVVAGELVVAAVPVCIEIDGVDVIM